MALSAMGPSERSEHLIYAIFPVSLSFYILLQLDLASDARIWVAFVTIFAPLLTVFLYEVGLDEFLVKDLARRYIRYSLQMEDERRGRGEDEQQNFKDSLMKFKLVIQGSEEAISSADLGLAIENAMSSYPVRKRLWRVRATVYVMISVILLVFIPFIPFSQQISETVTEKRSLISFEHAIDFATGLLVLLLLFFAGLLIVSVTLHGSKKYNALRWPVILSLLVSIVVFVWELFMYFAESNSHWPWTFLAILEVLIFSANWYRHRSLINNVQIVAAFLNLFNLLAGDSVEHPEQYVEYESVNDLPPQGVRWKLPVKNHLDYLDRVLVRGDWAVFLQSWRRIQETMPETYVDTN